MKPLQHFSRSYFSRSRRNQELYDELMREHAKILNLWQSLKYRFLLFLYRKKLKAKGVTAMLVTHNSLMNEYRKSGASDVRAKILALRKRLMPYQRDIARIKTLEMRLYEHRNARAEEQIARRDAIELRREANIYARLIIRAWNRMGYRHELHRGNRVIRKFVRFERIYVTPDDIQLKVDVSRLGLLDGTVHTLPQGVRAADLVSEETLRELAVTCERQISSPNTDGDVEWSRGVWLRIHRQNYSDGLPETVLYSAVIQRYPYDNHEKIPLPFGIKRGRIINWINLTEHPHILIAGQVGSGKTNSIRAFLSTIVTHHAPSDVRIALVDLKRAGDLNPFGKTPHAVCDVVKTVAETAELMERIVSLMEIRMDILSSAGVTKIEDYNKRAEVKMPRLMVVFDEFAATASAGDELRKRIMSAATRLATQSRAAGIHMWIGTQQSFGDVVPKQVRGNITLALSGRQRTLGGSMSVFGTGTARDIKKLPGRMICDDGTSSYQVQLPYISDNEVLESCAFARSEYDDIVFEWLESESAYQKAPEITREYILELALDEFSGALKARRLWEHINRPDVTLQSITSIVKRIAGEFSLEFRGVSYVIRRMPGNYYQLHSSDVSGGNTDGEAV